MTPHSTILSRSWLSVSASILVVMTHTASQSVAFSPAPRGAAPAAESLLAPKSAAQDFKATEGSPQPSSPSTTAPIVCKIDDVHSMALFRIQHMGAGQYWGRFNEVAGNFTFVPNKPDGMKFDVTIQTASVDSGNESLNKHLSSPDFFAIKDFPTMTFQSTAAKLVAEQVYEVTGNLTLHGVTKPITARVEFCGMKDMGRGSKAGFEAQFKVNRSDFGMNYGVDKGAIGNEVRVVVALEGDVVKP